MLKYKAMTFILVRILFFTFSFFHHFLFYVKTLILAWEVFGSIPGLVKSGTVDNAPTFELCCPGRAGFTHRLSRLKHRASEKIRGSHHEQRRPFLGVFTDLQWKKW